MKGLTRVLKWFLFNGLFGLAIYYGFYIGNENAARVAIFIAWVAAILSLCCLSDDIREALRKKGRSVPAPIDVTFDLLVVLAFVWHGAVATGVAYLVHLLMLNGSYGAKKGRVSL